MTHPYSDLPGDRLWRTAVSDRSAFDMAGLWKPKFRIGAKTRLATAGSCFAQHIGRALVARGYDWIDAEPAPEHMTEAAKRDFHYGTFSFRTGNIYTPRMLLQWIRWAAGSEAAPEMFWEKDGRVYDPFRPAVEKDGFASVEGMLLSRSVTIAAVRSALERAQVLVFTLGLTEAWHDRDGAVEYALCPGTVAGTFDPDRHVFVNHGFQSSFKSLKAAITQARRINSGLKVLLTVSPVPLTATASAQHVLTASSYSKSVLRAAAGEMAAISPNVDYFPSYEIINHPAFRGMFFEPNMRSVTRRGVDFVMEQFFEDQKRAFSRRVKVQDPYGIVSERIVAPDQPPPKRAIDAEEDAQDALEAVLCEEEMLDAFSR